VQRQNAQPATLFVFLFGRIVHRTIRIRSNSVKLLFGTPLILLPLTYSGVIVQYVGHWIMSKSHHFQFLVVHSHMHDSSVIKQYNVVVVEAG